MNAADETSAIVPTIPIDLANSSAEPAPSPGLPAAQHGATWRNTWKSAIPGVCPEALQHNDLSPRQMAAIHLMLRGQSDAQIAHELGINRGTVFRWRTKLKPFATELERQRQGMYHRSIDRLHSLLEPALKVLEDRMNDPAVASDPKMALRIVRLALSQKPDRNRRDTFKPDPIDDAAEAYVNIMMNRRDRARSLSPGEPKGGSTR